MISLHHAVQNGVSNGGIAHQGMPVLNGQLADDDGGFIGSPVINYLQQISLGPAAQAGFTPIV